MRVETTMRVGAIDIGTNSTRLLVADVDRDGRVDEIVRRLAITRLGEGVDETARLAGPAMRRVDDTVGTYVTEARGLGVTRILATATSAVRDAQNGPSFLEGIGSRHGVATRLLSGAAEASTTFRGVTSAGPIADGTLIVDIGGGSTELTVGGDDSVREAVSLQLGCVRLTERFLASDPPAEQDLAACAAHVELLLPGLAPGPAIGVAGTITTLAAVDLGLDAYAPERVHGHRLSREAVTGLYDRLRSVTLAERERILHLEPRRAPVIVAGAVILLGVMERYAIDAVTVSERDILHGIAQLAVAA